MRIAVMTGAGGVGKTTLAVNLSYELARQGLRVALFDLDPQGSINVACGISRNYPSKNSSAWIYSGFFDGEYSMVPVWQDFVSGLSVIRGGGSLFKVMPNLSQPGGIFLLRDALEEYPLSTDITIFDCPATLEFIPKSALLAATHLLVPLVPEAKAIDGTRVLLEWVSTAVREYQISGPQLLGFVFNAVGDGAEHQRLLREITQVYQERGYRVFPPIGHYKAVINAWSEAVPVRVHRQNHPILTSFEAICDDIQHQLRRHHVPASV